MATRTEYVDELSSEIAQEVWRRLSGNGSLRINIDTDVNCYGPWDPHGMTTGEDTHADRVADAQSWVEYFVRSAINRLVDRDLLNVPED